MAKKVVLTGLMFGRLTVIDETPVRKGGQVCWQVQCECGNRRIVRGASLTQGTSKSCGCLQKERASQYKTTHGMSKHPLYSTWISMRNRCYNRNEPAYEHYGARGISVCERWNSFELFLEDMGDKPTPSHSIDRIDNNGNYEPGNCRWATMKEQRLNQRPRKKK